MVSNPKTDGNKRKSRVKSKGLRLNWTSLKNVKEVRSSEILGEGEVIEIKPSRKPLLLP